MFQPCDIFWFGSKVLVDTESCIDQADQQFQEDQPEVGEGRLEWSYQQQVQEEYDGDNRVESHHRERLRFKGHINQGSQE